MEKYYTVRELSEKYDVPTRTIRKWINDGKLNLCPFRKKVYRGGYAATILESDFKHLLDSNKHQHESYMLGNCKGFRFIFSENQYKKVRFIDRRLKRDTGENIKDILDLVVNEFINDLYDDIKSFEE